MSDEKPVPQPPYEEQQNYPEQGAAQPETTQPAAAEPATPPAPPAPATAAESELSLEQEIEAALGGKSLDELMDEQEAEGKRKQAQPGTGSDIKRGRVIAIQKDDIFVELGSRTQGVITSDQFEPDKQPQVGDEIEVMIDRYDGENGLLILTKKGAAQKAAWDTMQKGDTVECRVTGVNKGGLECDLKGIRAFMPASQVDTSRIEDLSVFIGEKLTAEITDVDRKSKNVILSRRKLLEVTAAASREETLKDLAEGQVRPGTVKNIMPYGAFVDIGGLDGLLHISDMSHARISSPDEVVKIGQKVQVQVLKIEEGGNRIRLGLKQLEPSPWDNAAMKYKSGMTVKGSVKRLAAFGAFVEVEPGLEALLPISEMTYKKRINHPSEILRESESIEVRILDIDPARKRMSLSLKAMEANPWAGASQHYAANATVKGKVIRLTDFGAFIEVEPGLEGLAHISELSDAHVQRPGDVLRVGQEVDARVLSVDEDARRMSLSLKEAMPEAPSSYESSSQQAGQAQGDQQQAERKKKRPLKGGLE
jgi:small subunit ribosomal protein S1